MEKGHKRTRFPCLATARYVVAAVVSVLTVAVVVMVIIVALRPEKVIFSIPHQYIVANRLWWEDVPGMTTSSEHAPIPDTSFPLTTTYSPVKNVSFLVSFTAYNPSGRADVSGENVTIRVLDMPNYDGSPNSSFQTITLTEIELQDHFSVNRQTSYTLKKWILVDNATVLSYLAGMYGGSTSFTAMVQLNATIDNATQIYYCWPVFVVVSFRGYDRSSTSCLPEKEMDSNVSYSGLPPAPVPAPAPAPTAAAR